MTDVEHRLSEIDVVLTIILRNTIIAETQQEASSCLVVKLAESIGRVWRA